MPSVVLPEPDSPTRPSVLPFGRTTVIFPDSMPTKVRALMVACFVGAIAIFVGAYLKNGDPSGNNGCNQPAAIEVPFEQFGETEAILVAEFSRSLLQAPLLYIGDGVDELLVRDLSNESEHLAGVCVDASAGDASASDARKFVKSLAMGMTHVRAESPRRWCTP